MKITEDKIRQISREAQRYLGPNATPVMLKKIVKEVVKRLLTESDSEKNIYAIEK